MAGSLIVRRSALHAHHLALRATMEEESGWQRPVHYTSPQEEAQIVRECVGLCDISPVGKLDLQGKDTARVVTRLLPIEDAPQIGRVERLTLTRVQGFSHIAGLCCRLTGDHALLITTPGSAAAVQQMFRQHELTDTCVHLTDVTSGFTAVQLAGPLSRAVLNKLTALDLSPSQFPDLTCAQASIAKVHALLVRSDVGHLLAYELYCRREFGEYMWETLSDAGQEFGTVPFGIATQRLLQAERG